MTIHSIERDRNGRDFLVMEYVEGSTLRERLTSGVPDIDELLTIAAQVADALAAAHARGIVHRDLKPENVMLTGTGGAKLLDFGIAAHARLDADVETQLNGQTRISGTLSYMSPEQAAGEQIDFRSDQFSFGSILYEAASGVRAFAGANAAQTLAAVLQGKVRPLTELSPGMPEPLRWIIERCMAREPARRYALTNDLHRELVLLRTRLFEVRVTDQAPSVPVPRTSLVGRATELTTVTTLMLERDARLVTLKDCGHFAYLECAADVRRAVDDFFQGAPAKRQ